MKVYEKIYHYYLNKMMNGVLKTGERMPSLRESEKILDVSRTSVETAYMLLAADGYIYAKEKIGFFVSDMSERLAKQSSGNANSSDSSELCSSTDTTNPKHDLDGAKSHSLNYDLTTIAEDREVSCLNLWRRYMKSALRQEDRLLSYSHNQGEADLRQEIASYVRKTRNIICSPDDIVIGAGFQNLLQILIAIISGEKTISFPTKEFTDGATVFLNAGYKVSYRDKNSHVIYVTPSYMTKWGEIMPMKRRHELIEHARTDHHLIIEDDYQNEFVFSSKPTPSLYAMTGGDNVAFLGSFSRVLLPSVRISYLILPQGMAKTYHEIKELYNQTSSKAEQIALAMFLRDGHLHRHIRKMKRLYEEKRQIAIKALKETFPEECLFIGESGMEIGIQLSEMERIKIITFSQIPKEDIVKAVEELGKKKGC